MIPTSILTPFDSELTGIIIDNEEQVIDPQAPSRSTTSWVVKYTGLARIVDLSNQAVKIDNYDKQKAESYCIYLDRAYTGIITEGMRVKFRNDKLGENLAFVSDNSQNTVTGYIKREVKPQAGSRIGKLELYIITNN
jgi:hypothetical protein